MDVCVLLPTLNEAESIGEMIARVRKVDPKYAILVIDGGSSDGTERIARRAGAKIISVKRGKGVAIRKAFSSIKSQYAVLLDSDASYHPSEIPLLLKALQISDVAVGSRFKGRINPHAMCAVNMAGNRFLTLLANSLFGIKTTDVCSGFWAFRKRAYKKINVDALHFELEANFYVECARKGLKLGEVPITYSRRKGRTKLHILDGFSIGAYLIKKRLASNL